MLRLIVLSLGMFSVSWLAGCSLLMTFPEEVSQQQRFQQFETASQGAPVASDVSIHWDKHAIPFIEADNNQDLAFAVGLVHAHLRLGQMELLRHVAQGRVGELAGPVPNVSTIDHAMRMINLCRSGKASLQMMSADSKAWITHYTRGLNWYIQHQTGKPVEHRVFDLELTPFTEQDVMCISRLVSADLTWAFYAKFLKLAEQQGWQEALKHALKKRTEDSASFRNSDSSQLSNIITSLSKSGSNSLVISKQRSATGSALIANDPHVGVTLPNFWILVGMHSPDYHAFGLMIPGVPVIGVGRNRDIAWGGTNMRGISSHLIDVSSLPGEQMKTRTEVLKRRWWFDKTIEIRETEFGPIFTDLPFFDQEKQPFTLALDWLGQRGSDEIDAFLKVARASNWAEFRQAFDGYRVSAFNMLYADTQGNIGMMPAYGQPVLSQPEKTLDFIKSPDNAIRSVLSPIQQPNPFNPSAGFIASANNKPFAHPAIPYGFSFSNNDRYNRMKTLAENTEKVSLHDLKQWQRDTYSATSVALKESLVNAMTLVKNASFNSLQNDLKNWDGRFHSASRGAAVFEVLTFYAMQDYAEQASPEETMQEYLKGIDNWKPELLQWRAELSDAQLTGYLQDWLNATKNSLEDNTDWGTLTRQTQTTPLGMLPVIGSRFYSQDYPAEGGSDTLHKSGRQHSVDVEKIYYGSSARHISDMSSLDENYFVLHGGQDGWIIGPNLADQTKLWRQGEYVQVPLSLNKIADHFGRHTTRLKPRP